ncbi:Fur family transcriptional regulator [Inmirania thermothiophila]|uniref:Ferric uptake regulation protein n=1 Tax=Inmirania thermothiophila TaxID=1750597 RepID=A0A3N1Y917_9GAMM|nr:Fur family transcriptional regulator [Inmirania thermothiophila]ROR34988.1 Fur family iron response transcriptional regulator [Inmirania thermothiophila]
MNERTDQDDRLATRLRAHGIAPTRQRLAIARVLLAAPQHLSADELLDRVRAAGGRVSKATVYNTLAVFARKGLVREVIVDPARVFYDSNTAPHHHFYNVETGELIDVEAPDLPLDRLPPPPEGTVAEGVDLVIRIRGAARA